MFEPLNDMVLIRRIEMKTDSTLVIPDMAQEKSNKGSVVAVATNLPVEKGDTVLFSKYGAMDVQIDGEDLVLVRLSEIYGRELSN
jgi:chaperonin GroES